MSNTIIQGISSASNPYAQPYKITIDHTKCGSSDSSLYTDYVFMSNANLKTVANGGLIQHTVTVNGQTVPADLVFSSDSLAASLYSWEIKYYDGVNGIIHAFVNIPTVSHTTDTIYYVSYGRASISTYQGGAQGAAWDTANSAFKGIWHYPNGTTLSAVDATSHANTATISGATAGTGLMDGAASYASGNTIKAPSSTNYDSTTGCWSFVMNSTQSSSGYNLLMARADTSAHNGITISIQGTTPTAFVQMYNNTTAVVGGLTGGAHINDGNPHLIAYEFNGTNISTLYVDGVSVGTATPSAAWNFNSQTVDTGKTTETFWTPYIGTLYEERIMSNNPGAAWQLTLWNNISSPGNIGSPGFHTFT